MSEAQGPCWPDPLQLETVNDTSEEQLPTRQLETTVAQTPKDRSSKAVLLGWIGLLVGGLLGCIRLSAVVLYFGGALL